MLKIFPIFFTVNMKRVRYNKSAQQFETTPFKQAVQMEAPYAKGLFFHTLRMYKFLAGSQFDVARNVRNKV